MDFHLKQWRDQQQHEESGSSAKSPVGFLFDPTHPHPLQQQVADTSSALPLFSPEPSTKLSAFSPDSSSASTRFPKMGSGGGGYFSMGQWQELELQALIYRHMLTGSAVPPELLHLLFKKTLLNNSFPSHYLSHPLHHYPNFQPAMLQTGYWGRGAMDPEPGRCRRTDGKKWRCSRDVVSGHKYCERHIHRGRNRSRKPVEIPTPTSTTTGAGGGGDSGGVVKTDSFMGGSAQPFSSVGTHSAASPFFDHFHLNQRSTIENNGSFGLRNEMTDDDKSGGQILRHFFDDWPRTVQEQDNSGNNSSVTSATSLSISVPGNPCSDFSLKLSTGNGDEAGPNEERERPTLNWGMLWGTSPVASMGGPLAEALRSSTSSNASSPTSVLHQLQRGSTSETSYIST